MTMRLRDMREAHHPAEAMLADHDDDNAGHGTARRPRGIKASGPMTMTMQGMRQRHDPAEAMLAEAMPHDDDAAPSSNASGAMTMMPPPPRNSAGRACSMAHFWLRHSGAPDYSRPLRPGDQLGPMTNASYRFFFWPRDIVYIL